MQNSPPAQKTARELACSTEENTALTKMPQKSATTHFRKNPHSSSRTPAVKSAQLGRCSALSWGSRLPGLSMGPATSWGK